jgi:hypothetical protein
VNVTKTKKIVSLTCQVSYSTPFENDARVFHSTFGDMAFFKIIEKRKKDRERGKEKTKERKKDID